MTRSSREDRAVAAGVEAAQRFAGNAHRLAQAARVLVRTEDLRPRTLLYVPPRHRGRHGVAVVPRVAPPDAVSAMLAVAVGLQLQARRRPDRAAPRIYADGALEQPTPRDRAAIAFAAGFLGAEATAVARAG